MLTKNKLFTLKHSLKLAEIEEDLSDIVDDIDSGKCVLIIGPDLYDFGPKSFFETMCEDFLANAQNNGAIEDFKRKEKDASQYIFLNEELIQPKHGISNEVKVLRMVRKFYQKQRVFDNAFKKIAVMPFSLIISLMPDQRLPGIFDEQGLPYSFGYYPVEGIREEISEPPTKEKPLIYNILGSVERDDAVISFDSMFKFLSNILEHKLPAVVSKKLAESKTFIFLGVHFERWHAQLLLKIISPKGISYNISKKHHNHDVSLFVSNRLNLDLLNSPPENFLNRLFTECESRSSQGKPFLKVQNATTNATVFISYSHGDMDIAKSLTVKLKENKIEAIIDEYDMRGGERIEEFMNKIKDMDFIIPIISKSSLYKPFVFRELRMALDHNKRLIPCCLDLDLFDNKIQEEHNRIIDKQLGDLNSSIASSKDNNVDHLLRDRTRWIGYKADFPIVIDELRQIKCRPVTQDNISELVEIILQDIHTQIH